MTLKTHKRKILLVDDDFIARVALKSILECENYEVDAAKNGTEAILRMTHDFQLSPYTMILMDYHMPEMDGASVTQALRKLEKGHEKLIIIGLTAHVDPKIKAICIKAGMNALMNKPIDIKQFKKLINDLNEINRV